MSLVAGNYGLPPFCNAPWRSPFQFLLSFSLPYHIYSTYPFSDTPLFIGFPYFSVYLKIIFGNTKRVTNWLELSSSWPLEPESTLLSLLRFIPDPLHLCTLSLCSFRFWVHINRSISPRLLFGLHIFINTFVYINTCMLLFRTNISYASLAVRHLKIVTYK